MELPKVIQAGSEVMGSDGILAGIVDHVEGDRIQLVEPAGDPNRPSRLSRYIPIMLVAKIEDSRVLLSTKADAAVMFVDSTKVPSRQRGSSNSRS